MTTFLEILEEANRTITKAYGIPPSVLEPEEIPVCNMCHDFEIEDGLNEDGFCVDCQKAIDRGYQISQLAGRCANGAERDHGVRFHARILDEHNQASWKALCGYEPGRRSAGWSNWRPDDRGVTCPRCKQRLEKREIKNGKTS